jgi:hypothetical protein
MLDSKGILLNCIVTFLAAEAFARHPAESSGTDDVSFHGEESLEFSRRRASYCCSSVRQKFRPVGPSSRAPRKQRNLQHKTQLARETSSRTKADDRFLHRPRRIQSLPGCSRKLSRPERIFRIRQFDRRVLGVNHSTLRRRHPISASTVCLGLERARSRRWSESLEGGST